MLKKISGLFLGLVVLAGSACVTPTHASSAPGIIITKVQAASVATAKDEFIALYNATSQEVDITDWCLANKAKVQFACFHYADSTDRVIVPAYSYATVASNEYVINRHIESAYFSQTYPVSNQSSGSLVNSADTVTLINNSGEVVDSWSWTVAIPSGKVLTRLKLFTLPDVYATSGSGADWAIEAESPPVASGIVFREVIREAASDPSVEPEPEEASPPPSEPVTSPVVDPSPSLPFLPLAITELLPDALGNDTNNEFIELYNPNTMPISLNGYQVAIGAELEKTYTFPKTDSVAALSYYLFRNDVVKYSLNNTMSKLILKLNGTQVGPLIEYANPKEGEAWAFIDGAWRYTNQPTPGEVNMNSFVKESVTVEPPVSASVSTLKPCAANQYRSLETGRCRLLAVAVASTRTPCKDGQVRSEETGRCRIIASTKSVVACKAGQERNPDTGRCRNGAKMTKAAHGLQAPEKTNAKTGSTWYMWIAISGIIAIIIGYGVWEWREEVKHAWALIGGRFHKVSP